MASSSRYGAATGEARAWQAFLVNWLFFTTIASAAVMFAAVQRIVTARWSRGVIRFMEGWVAFLPIAAIGLLLVIVFGKGHIYPWWTWSNTGALIAEKDLWLQPLGSSMRSCDRDRSSRRCSRCSLWYIWTSVRLDVGILCRSTVRRGRSWDSREDARRLR